MGQAPFPIPAPLDLGLRPNRLRGLVGLGHALDPRAAPLRFLLRALPTATRRLSLYLARPHPRGRQGRGPRNQPSPNGMRNRFSTRPIDLAFEQLDSVKSGHARQVHRRGHKVRGRNPALTAPCGTTSRRSPRNSPRTAEREMLWMRVGGLALPLRGIVLPINASPRPSTLLFAGGMRWSTRPTGSCIRPTTGGTRS